MKTYARRAALLALVSATMLSVNATAAANPAKDPFLGSWLLDTDRSTFVPGPVPEERTMTFEMKNGAFHHLTSTRNLFLGGTDDIDYTAKFDGKDYPITGTGLETISLKRIDANTIERTGTVRGKVSETGTMKVSDDGKTLTVTIKGSYNGTNCSSVQVLTRQ